MKQLKFSKIILLIIIIGLITSCGSVQQPKVEEKIHNNYILIPDRKINKQKTTKRNNKTEIPQISFKNLSPLDTEKINISVENENYKKLLLAIAKIAGLNLIITDDVVKELPPERKNITVELQNITLRQALNIITDLLGVAYYIKNGIIFISLYEEKIFDLNFLTGLRGTNFELGGDVLGNISGNNQGTENNIISPLKGKIEIKGNLNAKNTDIYSTIEENIKKLLSDKGIFTINRYTGTIYVRDKVQNIRRITKLINKIKQKYNKQVLIEAKIIEVNLEKTFQYGINWQVILNNNLKDTLHLTSSTSFLWQDSKSLVLNLRGTPYFDSIIQAIAQYGTIKIVSNPRIRILNGQPAIIGIGKSISYIKEIDRQTTAYDGVTTVETTVDTSAVFDGLLFKVTPHISDNDEITLNIVPIKSDVIKLKTSKIDNYEITLPDVNLRETSTVINAKDNDVIVISGLIMDKNSDQKTYVPGISKIPLIGDLFKAKEESRSKVELVILMKASIIK